LRNQFHDMLAKVSDDLIRYHEHVEAATLSDPRFGDRSEERRTIIELEAALARLKLKNASPDWLIDSTLPALIEHDVEHMYAKASALQAKMHDRMGDFARDVRSEYRTWIFTEWVATIAAIIFLPL